MRVFQAGPAQQSSVTWALSTRVLAATSQASFPQGATGPGAWGDGSVGLEATGLHVRRSPALLRAAPA